MKSVVTIVLVVCSSPLSQSLQTSLLTLGYGVEIATSLTEILRKSRSVAVILWEEEFLCSRPSALTFVTTPILFLSNKTHKEASFPSSLRLPYTLRELCLAIEESLRIGNCKTLAPCEIPLEKILDNFPGCVFILRSSAEVLYTNRDCQQGASLLQNLNTESQSLLQQGLEMVFTYQEKVNFELWDRRSYYDCRLVPFTENSALLFLMNISGQKQVEKELREQEEYFRLLVENQLDFALRLDYQGKIEYASPTFCALVGMEEAEILGKTCFYFTHQDDWQISHKTMQALFAPPYTFSNEKRILTPSGDRWTAWSARAVLNDRSEVMAIVTLGRDIHGQKMSELALQENEEKLRFLAENTDQVFWILDRGGSLLYVNPAYERIWGQPCAKLYQNPFSWQEYVHPEDAVEVRELFLLPYLEDFSCVYRILPSPDIVRWIEARCFIVDTEGKPYRILYTATDITDRVLGEENRLALEKERYASELRNHFFAMVSHELRTPLTSILTSTGILLFGKEALSEKLTRNLDRIQGSAKYMLELIENLLIFARAEAGALQQNLVPVFLEKFCKQLLEEVARTYDRQTDATFRYLPQAPLKYIDIDEVLLRIVLSNLLVNAFKFSGAGSPVVLLVSLLSEQVIFVVSDRGEGIPPEEIVHIFKPFYLRKQGRGTGLGLSVVHKCVETMGGKIMVESIPDQGSCFTVQLPYLSPDP